MKRSLLLFFAVFFHAVTEAQMPSDTVTFEGNISFLVPGNHTQVNDGDTEVISAQGEFGSIILTRRIIHSPQLDVSDYGELDEFYDGIQDVTTKASRGTIVYKKSIDIDAFKARQFGYESIRSNGSATTEAIVILIRNAAYLVRYEYAESAKAQAQKERDQLFKTIFIAPGTQASEQFPDEPINTKGYRIGYVMGYIAPIILFIGLLFAIVFVIIRLSTKKRKSEN